MSTAPNRPSAVEIAVRYGFREYVCVLKWNPTSETIDRVAIRRAGSHARLPPATENAVYRKALVDPQIRSRVIQAMFPTDERLLESSGEAALEHQINNAGLWLGLAAFALIGAAIYTAGRYIATQLSGELADAILVLPAVLAILVVLPVRSLHGRYARRRYCAAHGHVLSEFDAKDGSRVVMCKRCSAFLQGPSIG